MNSIVQFILSLSISLTVIIGVIKFKTIDRSYYPFFYLAAVSLLVEILYFILSQYKMYDAAGVMMNIFIMIEFGCFTWLFHEWGLFNFNKKIFSLIMTLVFAAWVFFVVIFIGITKTNFYFSLLYASILVVFAVTAFNKLVITDRGNIFLNPKFWILIGVMIFYSFYILRYSAHLSVFGQNASLTLKKGIYSIVSYANLFVNLIFAIAALCIPSKNRNFSKLF